MKPVIKQIITEGDASGDVTSITVDAQFMMQATVQATMASTATGALKLQGSNDDTHWSDITNATVSVAGAGTYAIQLVELCFKSVRAVYTRSGNSGTLNAWLKGNSF